MYEELIKRLKDYSTARKGEIAELTEEAADAIEELNRLRVAAEENRMHWQDMAVKFECDLHDAEGKIPKWVEEWKKKNPPIRRKPKTNYDLLISKTPEELATFFGTLPCCPPGNADELCFPDNTCGADTKMMVKCWGTWLKAPVEVDNGTT